MIVFAGLGWLTYVIALAAVPVAGLLVDVLRVPGDPIAWTGACWAVVGGALQWLVGRAVNSERTPQGRTWHDRHTTGGRPMQECVGIHVFLGLTVVALRGGQLVSPLAGWLLFAGAAGVAYLVGFLAVHGELPRLRRGTPARQRPRAAATAVPSRRALAKDQGWRHRRSWGGPIKAWDRRPGPRVTLLTDDVMTGERRGRAITVFDLMAAPGVSPTRLQASRRTVVRIALDTVVPVPNALVAPVGTLVELDGTPPWEPVRGSTITGLRVESADRSLAERFLTRPVLAATEAAGLLGWRVEEGELLYVGEPGRTLDNDGLLRLVDTLIGIAQLVPRTPSATPQSQSVPRPRAAEQPAPPARPAGPRVITARHVRLTADPERLVVHRRSAGPAAGWTEHLAVEWPRLRELVFDTQGLDPVVALFALLDEGPRRYVADAGHLSRPEWSTFAAVVADCTAGRLAIDLDRRDDPRGVRDS